MSNQNLANPPVASVKALLANEHAEGSEVLVQGWVRTRRDSKAGFSFIHLNDGSCLSNIQLVADQALPNYQSEILKLTSGSSVQCHGTVVASKGKGQSVEIQVGAIEVMGLVEDPDTYPIQPKQHSYEFLRTVAHLRPRTNTFGAVTRIRHAAAKAIHRFFDEEGYCWVNTPIITASDAEGAGQPAIIPWFQDRQQSRWRKSKGYLGPSQTARWPPIKTSRLDGEAFSAATLGSHVGVFEAKLAHQAILHKVNHRPSHHF